MHPDRNWSVGIHILLAALNSFSILSVTCVIRSGFPQNKGGITWKYWL